MAGKFIVTKDNKVKFRFTVKASNREVIAICEGYAAKASALNGVESVRKNAATASAADET